MSDLYSFTIFTDDLGEQLDADVNLFERHCGVSEDETCAIWPRVLGSGFVEWSDGIDAEARVYCRLHEVSFLDSGYGVQPQDHVESGIGADWRSNPGQVSADGFEEGGAPLCILAAYLPNVPLICSCGDQLGQALLLEQGRVPVSKPLQRCDDVA